MSEYRIYVASLSDYNNGVLIGEWIDCLGKSADELQDEANAMLRRSLHPNVTVTCPTCEGEGSCWDCNDRGVVPSAEEFAIHDHEGFGDLLDEYSGLQRVAELCELFDRLEDEGIDSELFAAWADNFGHDVDEASVESFQDAYAGCGSSLVDWVQEFVNDTGMLDGVDENIARYFDYESYARDLRYGGDVFTVRHDGMTHVFWNH